MRNLRKITIILCGFLAAGCNTENRESHFADRAVLPTSALFIVGALTTSVKIPPDFDYKARMRKQLENRLSEEHMLAVPGDPEAMTVDIMVTEFQGGSVEGRMFTANRESQASSIFAIKADLRRDGISLGVIDARRAVNGGGLFSDDAKEDMVISCMDVIVEEIEKKMGIDD